jgi:hypothetical protein
MKTAKKDIINENICGELNIRGELYGAKNDQRGTTG